MKVTKVTAKEAALAYAMQDVMAKMVKSKILIRLISIKDIEDCTKLLYEADKALYNAKGKAFSKVYNLP